ncbi:aldose 1-epimerase family protein [Winogradskyella aquimaris]|uniref:Aldose 1-epimerase family protein n=1 Tax=Winogradskyella aquimaris TaxID=864074 RepID=A0ABU5ESD2_9FLAO|nr:aldose 1-epimerase family protein [Winogradskyella aquimaris]MDY2587597.1 aldose 1-epimerase family protein [Winogradskyella aquimaris]
MPFIENNLLRIEVNQIGAELCSIRSTKNNIEFIWEANPEVWGSHAPNLFPIIGSMKENSYIYDGQKYSMPKHGFVRHNKDFKMISNSNSEMTFQLKSNDQLRAIYPFEFEFLITYELKDNELLLHHTVKNKDNKTMYFSLGGHPAFACPVYEEETYTDYFLEFESEETSKSHLLNMATGLVTDKTKSVFNSPNTINLHGELFNEDALIFKDLKSRQVALKHQDKGEVLKVNFEGFPFLGIWAKPNAPYVCIEPWIGIADSENTNQLLKDKEGIVALEANETFSATYSITVNSSLLN